MDNFIVSRHAVDNIYKVRNPRGRRDSLFIIIYLAILVFGIQGVFADVIIDNGGSGTSSTGTWSVSSGTSPYGSNSLGTRNNATYTWQMSGQPAGTYEVLMWWTQLSTRSTSVHIDINHAGGTSTIFVNQRQNGGKWNSLGIFDFNSTGSVTITATSSSTISACADAVWYRQFAGPMPTEIIVDNRSAVTSQTGTWSVSSSPNPYGTDSVYGRSGATFTWYANLPQEGTYDVYMWWTQASNRSTSAPVTIQHSGGSNSININQQQNGGKWNLLGRYTFAKTGSSFVRLSAPGASPITYSADAVKFNFIELNNAPVAVIDSMGPDPAQAGDIVYFEGHGEDSDGNIAAYSWESDIDGVLSNEASFSTADFSEGEHIITFKVQDDKGKWSQPATDYLVVGNIPPIAFVDSVTPNPVLAGKSVTFTGHGEDFDGTVEAYNWHSSIDGNLNNAASFDTNALSVGQHTITFTVYDNNNAPSKPVTRTLTINNLVTEVIIDNGQQGTSSTGTWSVSSVAGFYGVNSLWARNGATYTWRFSPSATGQYDVFMWWTQYSSRSSNIPVSIQYMGGTTTVYINQQANGSKWNLLGRYTFAAGQSYNMTITAATGSTVSTCADAMRFVYTGSAGNIPPVATIDSITPNPVEVNNPVNFVGHGQDIDNSIVAYNWRSSRDGNLSSASSFSKSSLSQGTHTIYLKVQSDDSIWSPEVSRTLEVKVTPIENIFACYGYGVDDQRSPFTTWLNDIADYQGDGVWIYNTPNKTYIIRTVDSIPEAITALTTENSHILINGHSNYGLGLSFATLQEFRNQQIDDIRYIDDDRILNISTKWVHVGVNGLRTSQAYPYWWPIYKDGTSGVMPYTFNDPNGSPPYNYFVTYQVPGDSNHYKIETARNSAVKRFFDSSVPAWYSPTGEEPAPNNPDHQQYFIVNNASWTPSFVTTGNWEQSQTTSGYFKENYLTTPAGSGENTAKYIFTIPKPDNYKVYAWWTSSSSRAADAPYIVNHGGGSETILVDQRSNGGRWNELGEFYFNAAGYSVLQTNNVLSGSVIADAVKVVHPNNPPEALAADFIAVTNTFTRIGPATLNVTFYNMSVGDYTARSWNFGDGFTNATRDLVDHKYTSPGVYTVRLTVSGPLGSSTKTKTGYIVVGNNVTPPLQAEFIASSNVGAAPLRVIFSDFSSGNLKEGMTYTPQAGFSGLDTFTYTVADNEGAVSSETAVNVKVNMPNISPTAINDSVITKKELSKNIGVAANDIDSDGTINISSVIVVAAPANGEVSVGGSYYGGSSSVKYTPLPGFVGVDSFTYTIKDNEGAVSNTATVTVNVTTDNIAPVAAKDSVYKIGSSPATIKVLSNDSDVDGSLDGNTVVIVDSPDNGLAVVNANGTVTYTPNAGFVGTDTFTYTVADDLGAVSNIATVSVSTHNLPPKTVTDWVVTTANTPVTIDVLSNDTDAEGSILRETLAIVNTPDHGSCVIHDCWLWDFGDGSFSHDRNPARHTYTTPNNYTVKLKITSLDGNSVTETKTNFVCANIFAKSIDNVDYPKTHTGSKVVVYRKNMDVPLDQIKCKRVFYYGCNTGNYYTEAFGHNGETMFYTTNLSTMTSGTAFYAYLKPYFEGKSNYQIWQELDAREPIFDYYDFSKRPDQQQ
jgi:PKD repeat protein